MPDYAEPLARRFDGRRDESEPLRHPEDGAERAALARHAEIAGGEAVDGPAGVLDEEPRLLRQGEIVVEGIKTNVPLHQEIFQHAAFRAGGTDIHYLERRLGLK